MTELLAMVDPAVLTVVVLGVIILIISIWGG